MEKGRRITEMKNNIVNAKEVGFSIAKILGESTGNLLKKGKFKKR